MDMQAQLGRGHPWRTSLRLESMVSMEKSLVSLESLMVFILDPSYTIRFVPFWKVLIFL